MADVYTTEYQGAHIDQPRNPPSASIYRGDVKQVQGTYEAASAAIGTDILVVQLSKGDVILPETIVTHDALGASTTVAIEVRDRTPTATETELYAAEATSSAGTVGGDGDIAIFPHTLTEDGDVILKIAGGTATGTIKVDVRFVDN